MTTLHITRGLPGSGKSTFAREWVAADPARRARINRDDVRALVHAPHAGHSTETATTMVCHSSLRSLLRKGWDVICDDTNLNAGNVRSLMKLAQQVGADVEFHDFPISADEAKQRDDNRAEGHVGGHVIDKFARYLRNGELPPPPVLTPPPTFEPYTAKPGTPKAVIVDIDGTLAHNYGHRSPYDYSKVGDDRAHKPIVTLLWHLIDNGYQPIIMSGRDDSCEEATIEWLFDRCHLGTADYEGPFMRASGDKRDDAIVKLELFDEHVRGRFDARYVLDDRNRVVKAWRSIGLTVLQVADGDF